MGRYEKEAKEKCHFKGFLSCILITVKLITVFSPFRNVPPLNIIPLLSKIHLLVMDLKIHSLKSKLQIETKLGVMKELLEKFAVVTEFVLAKYFSNFEIAQYISKDFN